MKLLREVAIAAVALAPVVGLAAELGANPVDRFTVRKVTASRTVKGNHGESVKAAAGHRFVTFDVRVDGPIKDVDADDFQLVKEKAARLGAEQNVGDNTSDDYFFWEPADKEGHVVASLPADARDPASA